MRIIPFAAVLVLLLAGTASADSWLPPQPQLATSDDGAWYVAFNPGETYSKGTTLLVKRAPRKPPRTAPKRPGDALSQAASIEPEAGDVVKARVETHVPMELRCLNGGAGFVLFDTYAWVGMGTVLARYDHTGKQVWTRKLGDFFTRQQIDTFRHTVSSIWWSKGLWIDEGRSKVVVVYELDGPQILEVDLETGAHEPGRSASVLDRLAKGTVEEKTLALALATHLGLPELLDLVRAQFARTDLAPEIRIRFAVVMARAGDHTGDEFVLRHVAKGQPKELRKLAVGSLPVLLGDGALPHLRDAMRGEADEAWHAAMKGFKTLGAEAVPTLIEMVGEEGESSDYRGGAAMTLGYLGDAARPATAALLAAARTAPEYVANAALNSLIDILPPTELGPRLVTLLAAGSSDDGRIALYFQEHPRRDAVRALEAARKRHRDDEHSTTREWIEEALAKCRRH